MSIDTENNHGDAVAERLGEQICELAGHQAAAMCRWLLLIADFNSREGWAVDGIISCAHWLSWRCGIALGTARDHVTVARKLANLPLTVARFSSGELSYAKVRALVRIAKPDTEERLVDLALDATASQFEQIVREFKRSEREALDTAAKRRSRRYLRHRYDQDGSMIITIRLEPEEGALVLDYVEALASAEARQKPRETESEAEPTAPELTGTAPPPASPPASPADPPDARPPSPPAATAPAAPAAPPRSSAEEPAPDENDFETSPGERARADALVALARRAAITLDSDGGFVVGDRPHLLIHLDINAFGRADGCHLDHGPALPFETACRLGCEGTVAVLIKGEDGNPLHLGDASHGINRAQRRALLARDKGCRFPGCTNRRFLHAHHIKHWIDGGPTCIANLVLLCSRHHHLVHEGGFGCTGANGNVTFTRPDDHRAIPAVPTPEPVDPAGGIVAQSQELGLTITDSTPGSRSNGARYSRVFTSDVLWSLIHPNEFFGDADEEPGEAAA